MLYEKAQKLTINQEYEQAVEIFVEILQLPYLNVSVSGETFFGLSYIILWVKFNVGLNRNQKRRRYLQSNFSFA